MNTQYVGVGMIPKATWVLRKDSISVVAVCEFESDRQDFGKDTPG